MVQNFNTIIYKVHIFWCHNCIKFFIVILWNLMAKLLSEGLQSLVPQIKPNPNGCQYTLMSHFEWYFSFKWHGLLLSTSPPRDSDIPTALAKNVTFTNFCLDSLHSATASFWSSINLQKSLFHLINWSINTFKAEISEDNWVLRFY